MRLLHWLNKLRKFIYTWVISIELLGKSCKTLIMNFIAYIESIFEWAICGFYLFYGSLIMENELISDSDLNVGEISSAINYL